MQLSKVKLTQFIQIVSRKNYKINSFFFCQNGQGLTLYILTSICIFSILFYTFPYVLTRRICLTVKAALVGDNFLYSCDLHV